MTRHRQKDAEGSELMTRKRAWKDAEGRIVKKRPALDHNNEDMNTVAARFVTTAPHSHPLSPPGSAFSQLTESPEQALGSGHTHTDTSQLSEANRSSLQPSTVENDQGLFWESIPLLADPYSIGPFDDTFGPDTASSFNMPYTTMTNYNWLFNFSLDAALHPELPLEIMSGNDNTAQAAMNIQKDGTERVENEHNQQMGNHRTHSVQSTARVGHTSRSHYQPPRTLLQEAPMYLLEPDRRLPIVDELTRERLLAIIVSCRPTSPDGTLLDQNHPLLPLASLQSYLDLFFTRFNTVYPLIHLATFDAGRTEPTLLLSVILLGATYADKEPHQLAVCIHDVLRPYIFSCPGFNARAELWVLQAILLTECLGKSRGGQRQHDMSHLFHGLLINLIRRSECQTANPELIAKDAIDDIEAQWRKWVDLESKKRCV